MQSAAGPEYQSAIPTGRCRQIQNRPTQARIAGFRLNLAALFREQRRVDIAHQAKRFAVACFNFLKVHGGGGFDTLKAVKPGFRNGRQDCIEIAVRVKEHGHPQIPGGCHLGLPNG